MKTNIRKTILTGIMTCLSMTIAKADIPIDEAHFPDPGFRHCLKQAPFGEDGIITDAEIKGITNLTIWTEDDSYTIRSVEGIKYFTSMTSLDVTYTVDAIDVSECPQLKSLTVSLWGNSEMTSIDLSNNPLLEEFNCVGSAITKLDLTANTQLKTLFCYECEQLTDLNISTCKKLVDLRCNHTMLSSIDVSNCVNLYEFNCFECPNLTSVNVTNCGELTYFRCSDTPLTSVDVSTCKKLAEYFCERTNMTRLDLTPNGGITVLSCKENNIKEIILPNSLVLDIACQDNPQLTTLTIPGNAHLNTLNFSNTQVADVDLTSSTLLVGLVCNNTKLTSLDVTHCPDIEVLECTNTPLAALDLSNCTNLDNVILNDNQLTELKMPASCKVVTLKCQNNKISSLDLTGCRQMEWLECQNNQLTSLMMPDPIVYPDDYTDYRYELYNLDISVNQLKGAAVDAIIDKLPKKEWETSLLAYDTTVQSEGNVFTQAQVDAAKAKNWIVTDACTNPTGIHQVKSNKQDNAFYTLSGIRLQGKPILKGVYIQNGKKVLFK